MNHCRKNYSPSIPMKVVAFLIFLVLQLQSAGLRAQEEKQADIKLTFAQTDSTRTCKATVTSNNISVKEIEVHFYVQSMYALLPIGDAVATDSAGEALAEFPMDLPGDKNDNYVAVVKIEEDDTYGTVESKGNVKWGVSVKENENEVWGSRSLSASREKAPMYLIVVSNLIIGVIWGTIFYVIFQIFRIKKESRLLKK